MNPMFALDRAPLWLLGAGSVLLVLGSLLAGFWVGKHRQRSAEGPPDGPTGSAVAAILGLLAFILAFTFGMASSRFDARKQLVIEDANAIATAARRADLLPEPHRSESRKLLLRYVELRLEVARDPRTSPAALAETDSIENRLWTHALALARADMNSDIGALYVEALNELMAVRVTRATVALQYRIPPLVWQGLILLTVISMAALGFHFGIAGRGSIVVNLGLGLAFGAVILLIGQLDRPMGGPLQISQKPLADLYRKLAASAGPTAPADTTLPPQRR